MFFFNVGNEKLEKVVASRQKELFVISHLGRFDTKLAAKEVGHVLFIDGFACTVLRFILKQKLVNCLSWLIAL